MNNPSISVFANQPVENDALSAKCKVEIDSDSETGSTLELEPAWALKCPQISRCVQVPTSEDLESNQNSILIPRSIRSEVSFQSGMHRGS